jgi:hypothetical protein
MISFWGKLSYSIAYAFAKNGDGGLRVHIDFLQTTSNFHAVVAGWRRRHVYKVVCFLYFFSILFIVQVLCELNKFLVRPFS